MQDIFCENLKRLRQQQGMTQEQAAQALGVSPQSVSRWECGSTMPDVLLLPRIARLYGVTVDDLYREKTEVYKNYAQRLLAVYESTRRQEDFLAAQAEFDKIIRTGDSDAEDYFSCGVLYQYRMMDCADMAVAMLKLACQEAQEPALKLRVRLQQITLAQQLGAADVYAARQMEAVAAEDAGPEEYIVLLAALHSCGRDAEGARWFRRGVEQFPENAYLYYYGGLIRAGLGEREEAIACWERVLALDPDFADARYAIAEAYEQAGRTEDARRAWKQLAVRLEGQGYEIEVQYPQRALLKLL